MDLAGLRLSIRRCANVRESAAAPEAALCDSAGDLPASDGVFPHAMQSALAEVVPRRCVLDEAAAARLAWCDLPWATALVFRRPRLQSKASITVAQYETLALYVVERTAGLRSWVRATCRLVHALARLGGLGRAGRNNNARGQHGAATVVPRPAFTCSLASLARK